MAAAAVLRGAGAAATKKLTTSGAFSLVRRCGGGIRMPVCHQLFSSSSPSQAPPPTPSPPPPPSALPPSRPEHHHRVNPPDATNPDPVTLQEQWRYATQMYSKWYAQAWGTAILAGLSFYGLGWFIKGENPVQFGNREKEGEATLKPK